MVHIDIEYEGTLRCKSVHEPSGQVLLTDAPVDNQGKGEAFSPTDLVATALGTCIATTMGIVAAREGVELAGMRIGVDKEMTSVPSRRIARLFVRIEMPVPVTPVQRTKLERAAHHCPVHKTLLAGGVEIPIEFVYPQQEPSNTESAEGEGRD